MCQSMIFNGPICPPMSKISAGAFGKQGSALVENTISGNLMTTLIYRPSGSGEINMIHMTLPVTATMYLDTTNQWEIVGFEQRNEALQHIKTGRLHLYVPQILLK